MKAREKELEDYYRSEDKTIRQSIVDYIEENFDLDKEDNIKSDIEKLFDNKKSTQKSILLSNSNYQHERDKEKNIKTFIWTYGVKGLLPVTILLLFVFDVFNIRSGLFNKTEEALTNIKKESEESDRKIVEEVQKKKEYNPSQSTVYKDSYVNNVIHTTDFTKIYESDDFQNDWLLEAYGFISNELELPEEVAINFVSAEGALIKELSDAKAKIDIRFLENELEKMRAREEEVLKAQSEKFIAPENWKAFLAFRDQFYSKYFK